MSDDLPTPERLRRIEQGVQRRIDLRRLVARRIAGGSVAVVLVAGGFALLPHLGFSSAGGSGSSAGSAASSRSASVAVECHGTRTTTVRVDRSGLPGSAIAACGALGTATEGSRRPAAAGSAVPSPSPSASPRGALCRADDGALHLWPGAAATCEEHGMAPFAG